MVNRWSTIHSTHYRDNVETDFSIYMMVFDIVVGRLLKVDDLLVVDGRFWVCIQTVASGFHFNENECMAIQCYDVQVAMS